MSRILKRPMFRKGGEVMEGVMTGIKPRENYNTGSGNEGVIESVKNKMNLIDMIAGGSGPDNTAQFLIGGGLNLIDPEYQGDNILQTVASAYKKPTERLFAQQARDTQSKRALAGQLIAKSTVGDAAKAWKEYGKYTGLSEEAFYKQYGRSKLYKDEPTPQMKQAKLKGDFVKNLTKKKNFLQESDVDSNEAAQIFEGYQSLVNGNKDLAKQIDSGQLYKDEPTPEMKNAKLKGDFVKGLTSKKNFLGQADVDTTEAAEIFEGYQSLVNGNKDLAKQVDRGQLYIPKSAESFEQVKGGFVPNDTDGMRTNKIYFDFNNLMGQGQTWFLFDGTKLVPKARVD